MRDPSGNIQVQHVAYYRSCKHHNGQPVRHSLSQAEPCGSIMCLDQRLGVMVTRIVLCSLPVAIPRFIPRPTLGVAVKCKVSDWPPKNMEGEMKFLVEHRAHAVPSGVFISWLFSAPGKAVRL